MTLRALVLVVFLAPTAAFADGDALESARQAYEELRYDDASALLERALEEGALDGEERAEGLLLAGIVDVIRGDEASAHARFRELLERSPDATLPDGLSPKITRVFDEVRAGGRAGLPPEAPPESAPPPVVEPSAPEVTPSSPSPPSLPPEPPLPDAEADGGDAGLLVGLAAGAALTAIVVGVAAGTVFLFARGQPPASSLGTMQLP